MSANFDFSANTCKFRRPEILTHPHIPRNAHGMNPRTFKGDEWWDTQRKLAYGRNNNCCWACGIYSGDDPYKSWLEAHEMYSIDYEKGILCFQEIVALCWSCHKFIHSGRFYQTYLDGKVSKRTIVNVLNSRMDILSGHDLKPFWGTAAVLYQLNGMTRESAYMQIVKDGLVQWDTAAKSSITPHPEQWRLIVGMEIYNYRGERMELEEEARYGHLCK